MANGADTGGRGKATPAVTDGAGEPAGGGPRSDRLAVIGLCLLGLLVAAVAVPATAPTAGGGDAGAVDGDTPGYRVPGLIDVLRWVVEAVQSGDGGGQAEADCAIDVAPQPTPGRTVTVHVTHDGDPIAGAVVRFEGQTIGRTDAVGKVDGTVPYVRTLTIAVDLPGSHSCVRSAPTARSMLAGTGSGRSPGGRPAAQTRGNLTETVTVEGEVQLTIVGRADPGSTITVVARVAGVPMREAVVRVDDRTVATTDDAGRADVGVPADGTERLRITVRRGAFAGTRTVAVRLLRARVVPAGILAVPGQAAILEADIGTDPADGAVVSVGGRRIGTTDGIGRLRVTLPADPRTRLTVRHEGQTATAGVALLYLGTAVVLALPTLIVGAAAVAIARRRRVLGRRLGAVGRYVGRVCRSIGRLLGGGALLVAIALERASRWLIAGLRTLVRHARSGLPDIARSLLSAIRRSPARVAIALVGLVRRCARLPARLRTRIRSSRRAGHHARQSQRETPAGDEFDIRLAWRAIASRIAPDGWRVLTPREIVRVAADTRVPTEPLERLATAFEEVEYGNRPLVDDRLQRAKSAATTLLDGDRMADADEGGDSP